MKDNQTNEFYEFGEFRLDAKKRRLWKNGEPVALTPKEFEVLFVLIKRAGSVVEKDDLLDAVWKDIYVEEATLTRNISFLRKKLGANDEARFIETLPKRGYRFLPAVRKIENVPAALAIEEQTLTRITVEETVSLSEPPAVAGGFPQVQSQKSKVQSQLAANPPSAIRHPQLLWLAFGAVALAVIGFAVYQNFSGRKSNAQMVARVAPFSGLPGREDFPAFSPDGRQMAFAWNGGDGDNLDVYVKIIGAGEPVRLTGNEADDINPVYAPDGRFIAFIRSLSTASDVILISALGGAERKLATLRSARSSLSFAPDGKTLAVADNDSTRGETGIFLLDVETGAKRRVTSPPEFSSDGEPHFSPDGKSIVFVRAASPVAQEIYLVSTGGGGEARQLTADKTQIRGIAWSADGKQIVFASLRASNQLNLWQIAASGGEPVLIATGGKNPSHPAVAPDGKSIAYVEATTDSNIWQIEFDGAKKQIPPRKFIASSQADHSPNFSPDGGRVVFASDRTGNYEIWTADAGGANARQLTDLKTSAAGTPRVSPDGVSVAFDAQTDGKGDIFIIGAEGGSPRNLTANAAHDVLPAWSANGRFVYFCSDRNGERQIWKISADGGEAVQITRQGGFESFASPDGREIFYTKNRGVAGIWKVAVDGSEESAVAELAEAGYWRYWSVVQDGIYFVARASNPPYAIKFYSFASKQISDAAQLEKTPLWIYPGLAAAPDGKTLLYAQSDQNSSGIMLAELGK